MLGENVSSIEKPDYKVLLKKENIEIRSYMPSLVAEVEQSGTRKDAANSGFRILADYIFGNNKSNDNISMTAPVVQKSSEKISMTAPVTQYTNKSKWMIRFYLPKKYMLDTIPTPNNAMVKIYKTKERKYITIKFSGTSSETNIQEQTQLLLNYVKSSKISIDYNPIYAFYDPPWTLPFLRRNEIMFEIVK